MSVNVRILTYGHVLLVSTGNSRNSYNLNINSAFPSVPFVYRVYTYSFIHRGSWGPLREHRARPLEVISMGITPAAPLTPFPQ